SSLPEKMIFSNRLMPQMEKKFLKKKETNHDYRFLFSFTPLCDNVSCTHCAAAVAVTETGIYLLALAVDLIVDGLSGSNYRNACNAKRQTIKCAINTCNAQLHATTPPPRLCALQSSLHSKQRQRRLKCEIA
ncbi:unnamed protein product, partial [Ceratitis capitata]